MEHDAAYIKYQKGKAQRSLWITRKWASAKTNWAQDYLTNVVKINWKTMLCVGARDKSEPLAWKKLGYEVDAVDLVSSDYEGWQICDMSKMYLNEHLKNKKYDLVYMHNSLEHCMDLDGFVRGLDQVCGKYFYSLSPYQSDPTKWDCGHHPFMARLKDDVWVDRGKGILKKQAKELSKLNIAKCFPKFNLIHSSIGEAKNRIIMTLEKK